MPKRARSDDDENYSGGLVKTHVSQKEVNLGVLREQNMAKVHERTLNLLYRNTKFLPTQPVKLEIKKPSLDSTPYKQLSLNPGENALPISCFSCLRPSCLAVQTCTSCRKPVGATCVAKCNACPELSCRLCDFVAVCDVCGKSHCPSCTRNLCTWH